MIKILINYYWKLCVEVTLFPISEVILFVLRMLGAIEELYRG